MTDTPVEPSIGLGVLHLFLACGPQSNPEKLAEICEANPPRTQGDYGDAISTVLIEVLGHKADICLMC